MIDIEYLEKIAKGIQTYPGFGNIKHLKELDALGLSNNEYYIGSSANLILFGYPKVNDDLDINVAPSALPKLKGKIIKNKPNSINPTGYHDKSRLIDISVDNGTDPLGLGFNKMKNKTILVNGYRFLSVEGLKEFYAKIYSKYHMPKHALMIKWLDKFGTEKTASEKDEYIRWMGAFGKASDIPYPWHGVRKPIEF